MVRVAVAGLFAASLIVQQTAFAYLVASSVPLPELAELSDVIFKGTVVSSMAVEDESFKDVSGFETRETVFQVVSVVKGKVDQKEVRFRHFHVAQDQLVRMYSPQHYEFAMKGTYIVCAKPTKNARVLRQIWDAHRSQEDQGVLRAASADPHVGEQLADVYWNELRGLLRSGNEIDVIYAIDQLNVMSGIGYNSHQSIDRKKAVKEIGRLADVKNDVVAIKAIKAIGSENPSTDGSIAALTRLNPQNFPGIGSAPHSQQNVSAQTHIETLIRIAEKHVSTTRRAAAIMSLGRTMNPELLPLAQHWVEDAEPEIRSAAALLLADYVADVPSETWDKLLADDANAVRQTALRAIGLGQVTELLDQVSESLADPDRNVVATAAASLLSFPLQETRQIFQSQMNHPEFGCLFINALAAEDTATYTTQLAEIIRANPRPQRWWGGHIPWGVSWNLLFKYVQQQSVSDLQSGDFDAELLALESPVRERDKSMHYSSSEPRDLYALYLQRSLRDRAREYRTIVNEKTSYDMNHYFDQVDKNPSTYQRH